ncbi:MAG: LysM peptidoglycan-binding domain-containing protein [Phycisphaerales bacterium]|nr:LysM peptidoglycan-binding domain-containing protein [Phycisphaerales bacterium]
MQRIASVAIVSLFVLAVGTGCSLFGKKSTPAADAYDPTLDSTAQQGAYPTYQPLATDHSASTSAGGGRYHTVQKKETLYSIARQYYGDQAKWKDIYQANHSDISDPNKIRIGQRLVIP